MHDLVGGRYRLDEHIGNGGMAEVWRATDNRTGETVAVKRLHPRLAHDPTARARFAREVEAARCGSSASQALRGAAHKMSIAVAAFPTGHPGPGSVAERRAQDLQSLLAKQEAGADFAITQVFFVTEAADGVLAIPVSSLAENGSLRVQGAAGNVPETRRPVIGMRTRSHVAILSKA